MYIHIFFTLKLHTVSYFSPIPTKLSLMSSSRFSHSGMFNNLIYFLTTSVMDAKGDILTNQIEFIVQETKMGWNSSIHYCYYFYLLLFDFWSPIYYLEIKREEIVRIAFLVHMFRFFTSLFGFLPC